MSLRYAGFLDTETPSISIYSGIQNNPAGGIERTFTNLAHSNFGFLPTYMVITGRSSWTGFVNEDFTDNFTCFSTSELMKAVTIETEIRSIIQGCNGIV